MKLNEATLAQNDAATPVSSTWLSANAGSGKTRVLTDRVARLLLQKVPPQNILCLTYTKAAASEMQNRLFSRLGDWAMKSDGALADDLQRMGETGIGDPDRLAEARRLFARAIETPGGLRIQTIHSFCASLLRRFPLEAGVSPGFVEMDEHAADRLREEVVDRLAKTDPEALDAVAAYYTGEDFGAITQALVANRDAYSKSASRAEILDWFGVSGELTRDSILKSAFIGGEADLIADVAEIAAQSTPFYQKFGAALSAINAKAPTWDDLRALYSEFLFSEDKGGPRSKSANFPQSRHTKAVEAFAPVIDDLHAFMDRVTEAREAEHLLNAVEKTEALLKFAVPFLNLYEEQKRTRALLDFDDLIEKARALVSDSAVAEWVLYRLDGGLDHILVDEAQDTSPAQWHVIECLAREFSAGAGARATDTLRTVFAVGDKKQSIYSFQGADPREFDRMREHFRERMEGASLPFNRRELAFSFRSSQAVLALVETVFRDVPETRMEMDASHRAFHDTLPGRVDLWPLVEKEGEEEDANWYDPVDRVSAAHHEVVLARKIAEGIMAAIGKETIPLPDGTRRPVKAGDFLILVRRRSKLFSEVIRACKALDLPVAGADRLKLGGELAVKDIASLLSFLATPEDDLSLAEVLRSPLFGWSEGDLYDLAQGRGKTYLWTKLRQSGENHAETLAILDDLRGQADFLRPFDLIERILARHDGRRKLIARLGPEAEDGIDTLLSQALSYEQCEVPSLTGFLTWLETDEVEVKRQLDNVGDQIRVMTVHGSKGLESPIVILPDCAHRQYRNRDELIELENGMPVWKTGSAVSPRPIREAAEAKQELARQEDLRLLYVAITRAETWLITAAAGEAKEPGDSWYATIEAALTLMETSPLQTPVGDGVRYEHLDWNAGAVITPNTQASLKPDLPEWAALPVATPVTIEPINPSQMGGAKTLPGDGPEFGDAGALDRGTQVHRLLEVLPSLPREDWDNMANQLVAGEEAALVTQTARRILEDRDLGWMFGEDGLNEVEITANAGTTSIHGTIDRLIVLPDRVIAIDYKTNRIVPSSANDIPDGLLRQLGAYDHALQQIYPDRVIETAILWTETAQYMPVPHEIVRHAWHSYSTS